MARITMVKSAQASKKARYCVRCRHEVKPGEAYAHASFKTSPYSSMTRIWCFAHMTNIKGSERTANARLSTLYAAQESVEDVIRLDAGEYDFQQLAEALQGAAEEARGIGEEYEESASNVEDGFPNGSPVIDEIREKVEACENWADALESAATDIEDAAQRVEEFDPDKCAECDEDRDHPVHQPDDEEKDKDADGFDHEFEEPEKPGEDEWNDAVGAAENALGELEL